MLQLAGCGGQEGASGSVGWSVGGIGQALPQEFDELTKFTIAQIRPGRGGVAGQFAGGGGGGVVLNGDFCGDRDESLNRRLSGWAVRNGFGHGAGGGGGEGFGSPGFAGSDGCVIVEFMHEPVDALIATLHVGQPEPPDGLVTVLCTSMGGAELAEVTVDPEQTVIKLCDAVRAEVKQPLRLMMSDGTLLTDEYNERTLAELVGAPDADPLM